MLSAHLSIFPSLPSYPRRRCWSLAEIWRSQKWSVAGPWSFHTGRHLQAWACLSRWVEPEAGQSCHFLLSEGSHGDPQGGRNGKWTGHLERVTEDDNINTHRYIQYFKNYRIWYKVLIECSTVFLLANDCLDTIAKTKRKKPLLQLLTVQLFIWSLFKQIHTFILHRKADLKAWLANESPKFSYRNES